MKTLTLISVTLLFLLSGCNNAAKREAEAKQQAAAQATADGRTKFRESLAAMKVCTRSSTLVEFRKRRVDLETCYEANKQFLTDMKLDFLKLHFLMNSTERIFRRSLEYPDLPVAYLSTNLAAHIVAICPTLKESEVTFGAAASSFLSAVDEQCDRLMDKLK